MWRLVGLVVCGAACGLGGCRDPGPPLTKILETDHFVVLHEGGASAGCPLVGEWLEGHYRSFEAFLGVTRRSNRKITYKVYTDATAARAQCFGGGGKCYIPSEETVVTTELVDPHELAHIFENLVGTPVGGPTFFSEGIATLLGGPEVRNRPDYLVDTSVQIEDLLDNNRFKDAFHRLGVAVLYPAVAAFVHFLIQRLGKPEFLSFYGSLDRVGIGPLIEQRFKARFGEDLRDVIAEWRRAPPPFVDEVRFMGAFCDLSPPLLPGAATFVDPECVYRGFGLEVPQSGRLDLIVEPDEDLSPTEASRLTLVRCQGGNLLSPAPFIYAPLHLALDVAPGRYVGLVSRNPATVRLSEDQVSVNDAGVCEVDRVQALIGGPQNVSFALARRWSAAERHPSFDLETGSSGQLRVEDISGGRATFPPTVYLCPEACLPDPDQTCARDHLPDVQSGRDPRDVFGRAISAGERLHFETGPRGAEIGYSLKLSVGPTPP